MKNWIATLGLIAAAPYAHGHAGGAADGAPAPSQRPASCRPHQYLNNGAGRPVSDQELGTYALRARMIVAALKPALSATGIEVDEASANFESIQSSDGSRHFGLVFNTATGTKLRAAFRTIIPLDNRYGGARWADTIFSGEPAQMSPVVDGRPIARVTQGFDREGNISVCNIVAAETEITAILNFHTGVNVAPNMAPVVVPSAVIASVSPVR